MQLFSPTAELRAILTITAKHIPESKRSTWLGKMNKDMFHNPVTKRAFERIDKIAKKRFKIISFKGLLEDPSLDEDLRDMLSTTKEKPCSKASQVNETIETLRHYRKIRIVYEVAMQALQQMEKPSIDIDALLSKVAGEIGKAQSNAADEEFFLHFGANDTGDEVLNKILNGETVPRLKTGFKEYDEKNGGFPDNGVVIIAATTSGGKSTVAMNICRHMYSVNNLSTFRVTLEMQELQETQRLLSHLTGIPLERFVKGTLTPGDKKTIKKAMQKFRAHGKKHGINYTTWSPKAGQSMDDVLRMAKPFGYKVIVIDYVGLLEGSGEDQWKSLLDAVGTAKNFTRQTGTLVIILAQLDSGKDELRYSKGMAEHADTFWKWNYSKDEQRELRRIPVIVAKDRDAPLMTFDLEERFDIMTAYSVGDGESHGSGNVEYEEETASDEGGERALS